MASAPSGSARLDSPAPAADGDDAPGAAAEQVPRRAVEAVAAVFREGLPPAVEDILLAALGAGPATGRELARVVETAAPGFLDGREGWLYPVLHQMVRDGALEARWRERTVRRPRRQYALPGGFGEGAPAPGPGSAPRPLAGSAVLDRAAREATRSIPAPFAREEARAELLGHLEDAARPHVATGVPAADACRAAVRELGDPWHVRSDLGRVHRGRRVIVFPHTPAERVLAFLRDEVVPLVLALALILLLRWKVVQAYNIPTKSMEPTLYGSTDDPDFILVNKTAYLFSPPERWDIAVFYPPREADSADPTAFVKRCVGLPGDLLDIRGGDIHVDGTLVRRPAAIEDAMMVESYDLRRDFGEEGPGGDVLSSWKQMEGAWSVEGSALVAVPSGDGAARLQLRRHPDNSYRDGAGKPMRHYQEVGDLEVRAEATPLAPGATVGVTLHEGEERFRLAVGPAGALLEGSGLGARASPSIRAVPGRTLELRLRNVDDRVTAWVDGEILFRVERPPRAVVPLDAEPGEVALLAEGGGASFAGVRVLRDILYQRAGPSLQWPIRVPEGHVFMMGDNTASSNDSRMWGPVRIADLVGSPFVVIYPFTRVRTLR